MSRLHKTFKTCTPTKTDRVNDVGNIVNVGDHFNTFQSVTNIIICENVALVTEIVCWTHEMHLGAKLNQVFYQDFFACNMEESQYMVQGALNNLTYGYSDVDG